MKYSIKEIAEILNLSSENLKDAEIEHLLTDSRSLTYPESSLFFALKTTNNDGHRFVSELYDKGVRNFVVQEEWNGRAEYADANFLTVKSSIDALHTLVKVHRAKFNIPVIAITGSKGKTVVKEWLYQLLHDDFRIVRSPRSFNSQIGVPLSLWEIDENTNLAIVEAGISRRGEMKSLTGMIAPTIGVFTNLDDEHAYGFASIEEKCAEKCSLLIGCETIVYEADEVLISKTVKENCSNSRYVAWTRVGADAAIAIPFVEIKAESSVVKYRYQGEESEFELPFNSKFDIQNAVHCLAVMLHLGIKRDVIASRMASLAPANTRLAVFDGCNNCLLTCDSYTSDYNSLAPALDFMARRATSLRNATVILSDVTHEAYSDEVLYKKVAKLLELKKVKRVIGIGEEITRHKDCFIANSQFFKSTDEFMQNCSTSDFENEQILIKGAPSFGFSRISDMLETKQHETVLEVNLDAIASNFNFYRSKLKPETKVVCMVKAKGYGAGSYEIAKTLQDRGASYLAVAVLDEGVDLRKAGITMPIMVLNPKVMNYRTMFSYKLEPEIYSIQMCREIIREAEKCGIKNYPVHIKLDTGMHRLGFLKEQLPELVELLQSQDAIKPHSVFSHLATADCFDMDEYTERQFAYFNDCCETLQAGFSHHIIRHILNTAGIIRFPQHQNDMVRLGIGLYGVPILNDGSENGLKHVSSLRTVIISIKEWEAGTAIG